MSGIKYIVFTSPPVYYIERNKGIDFKVYCYSPFFFFKLLFELLDSLLFSYSKSKSLG